MCPDITFRCRYGACLHKNVICDGVIDCIDGSDEDFCHNSSMTCKPIISKNILADCYHKHKRVRCDQHIKPGTRVDYKCKSNFISFGDKNLGNHFSICQANGIWLRDILKCQPKCGVISRTEEFVYNGWESQLSFPWHVQLQTKTQTEWETWCGGTIITDLVLITAAHCVWKQKLNELRIKKENKHFGIDTIVSHPLYLDRVMLRNKEL